jgi:hypothetical protein
MAVHLMTTTGTEADVRAALGLTPEASQATTPPDGPVSASVETLPKPVSDKEPSAPAEPPVAAPDAPAAPVDDSEEEPTSDASPQERGAQTKGRLQKRIDELVAARYKTQGELEAAQRQIAELQAKISPPAPTTGSVAAPMSAATPPQEADFDTYDKYLVALAKFEARQEVETRLAEAKAAEEAKRVQAEAESRRSTLKDRIVAFAKQHTDYEEVVNNPDLPNMTPVVADVLTDPDNELGPAMAYALAKNPTRFAEIVALPPKKAILALGALQAELRTEPAPAPAALPKLPAAPPPPTQVRGSTVVAAQTLEELAKGITPGDPRTSEWLARRNAEIAKRGQR